MTRNVLITFIILILGASPSVYSQALGGYSMGRGPRDLVAMGGNLYFLNDEGLWTSGSGENSVRLVKRLEDFSHGLVLEGAALFFQTTTEPMGSSVYIQLWQSDGSTGGTIPLLGDSVYVYVDDGVARGVAIPESGGLQYDVMATDQYFLIATHYLGSESRRKSKLYISSSLIKPELLGEYDPGSLYLVGFDGNKGFFRANRGEIWVVPGEEQEARVLISNPYAAYYLPKEEGPLTAGYDTEHGEELWSQGRMIKDIRPGTNGSYPDYFFTYPGGDFFTADDGVHGRELWRSDGTLEGTVLVKDLYPGPEGSSPACFTVQTGQFYFIALGRELWKSDGTESGTVKIIANIGAYQRNVKALNIYGSSDKETGSELYGYSPGDSKALLIKDINPGKDSSYPSGFAAAADLVYFSANDGSNGSELWATDGTGKGTYLVKDIRKGAESSSPMEFTPGGDVIYFTANDGINGVQLWRSDGSERGTIPVSRLDKEGGENYIRDLVFTGGVLYFVSSRLVDCDITPGKDCPENTIITEFELLSVPESGDSAVLIKKWTYQELKPEESNDPLEQDLHLYMIP